MPIPILDLKAQYQEIRAEIHAAIDRVLESQIFILGPEVEALEEELAQYSHCQYGIGVSSGTDALLVSLMAIGIQPGDEVITSAYSFFATAGSIARLGAIPVFADILPDSFNIDPDKIETLITPKTRAIIPVHLAGQCADMDPILALAKKHGLYVIEDACQAIGADYRGQRAGSLGQLACFSFFPSKNLGGYGDSGMVTTNDPQLAEKVRLLRNHGHKPKYYNPVVGGNFRMDAIQAAVLRVKFKYLEGWIERRRQHALSYQKLFSEAGIGTQFSLDLPQEKPWGRHVYHLYILKTARRNALMAALKENGIGSEVYYPVPLHLQECFKALGYQPKDLPVSEWAAQSSLAIPIYPELSEDMQREIVAAIARSLG